MSNNFKHQWRDKNWQKGDWDGNPGCLFVWFIFMFGTIVVLLLGGAALLFYMGVTAFQNADSPQNVLLYACGLIILIPILLMLIGGRTFSGVKVVAEVMKAADQVADGNLSARVPEKQQGNRRFKRLAKSFNNMASELEKEDERRRNLTADIAHELRTPLHIIQGNLEGVLDGVYEASPEHLKATIEETHTLARLVDDLHTIAQAEAGQLRLQLSEVDVSELLADVHTSFSGRAEENGVTLTVSASAPAGDLTLVADAGRLDQVLSNLLVNALRHSHAAGTIQLEAYAQENSVVIRVTDTGEGIPEEDLPFIFDRFWRGDRARSHLAGEGGGLGLAIAKQLIEAHNGRIAVTSQLNQGTTFTLILPKQQAQTPGLVQNL